ncbi:MAG TPA: ABC transporter permease subunit [Ktedonobacteraceae bacterium]|nr:ABC transporter permease subunit [Ktedonobacteraceae bacterium]
MSQTGWSTPSFSPQSPLPAPPVISTLPGQTRQAANLWQLTYNELYKLWKRRLVWAMLGLDLFFVLAAYAVLVFYSSKTSDGFTAGHLLGGANALTDGIGQPMTLGRRGGEFIAAALGGLAFGGEFSSGAIRLVLSRGVNRASYLGAKFLALIAVCAAMVLAELVMSAVLVNFLDLLPNAHGHAPTLLNLNGPTFLALAGVCFGTFENFVLCLLLGATVSIISRSAAFGIAAAFGYLIGEDIAAQIIPVIGKSLHVVPLSDFVNNLLFTTNLNAFYANTLPKFLASGLDRLDGVIACNTTAKACETVSTGQSFLVPLIWALILGGVSVYLFIKRDVLQ